MTGSAAIERCRYGPASVWLVRGALSGGAARRLAERVRHHFNSDEPSLVLDLRNLDSLDACGVAQLQRCRSRHPGLRIVGRPYGWEALPLRLRLGIAEVALEKDLVSALAPAVATRGAGAGVRRHPRIPVGIPIELLFDGRDAPATLTDLSRGGLRLARLTARFAEALSAGERPAFSVLGLGDDPLGRELLGAAAASPVSAVPVHVLPGGGIGARFTESRPPA